RADFSGQAAVGAAGRHPDLGQEVGQRPHRGRLGGALLAAYQDPTDLRVDRVQRQGQLHLLLADQCCERENGAAQASVLDSRTVSICRYACCNASFCSFDGFFHMPRSIASSSLSAIPRSAHGFFSLKNRCSSWSCTYASVTRSYIQSSTI